jgi:predicted O-methyltransferase YrrM
LTYSLENRAGAELGADSDVRVLRQVRHAANGMLPIEVYAEIFRRGQVSKGGTFVEIGTAHGAATIALGLGAIESKYPFHIYTVDPFSGKFSSRTRYGTVEQNERIVQELLRRFGVDSYITVVTGVSSDLIERHPIESIDILLLDADGRIDRDLALFYSRLSAKAQVIVDDLAGLTHVSNSNGMLVLDQKQHVAKCLTDKFTSIGVLRQEMKIHDTGFYSIGEARMSADEIALSALPIYRELVFTDVTRFGNSLSASNAIDRRLWKARFRQWAAAHIPGARFLYHAVKGAIASDRSDGIASTKDERRNPEAVGNIQHSMANLCAFGRDRLERILRSPGIGAEWPDVDQSISAVLEILDGKTGGVNPGDRRALYYLARGIEANSILEIGTHVGASTLHLAAALLRGKSAERLVTVDIVGVNDGENAPWMAAGLSKSPREAVKALGAEGLVEFVHDESLRFFDRTDALFDLIFLDGDHSEEAVYREIPKALTKLKPNGSILLHDFFPGNRSLWRDSPPISGPFLAVERLRREGARIRALPLGELPWPTKAGSNVTSLALLAPNG